MKVFTFGYGQHCGCGRSLRDCYTELPDVDAVYRLWGQQWSREYADRAAAGVDEYGLHRIVTDEHNPACRCGGMGRHVPWANAGGPNECPHGYAAGIACPHCGGDR